MKILLIGGAGYIGSSLAPKLLERNYHVGVIDSFMFGDHLPSEVSTSQKDIFDITEDDMRAYDCVIFLAGLSNDPMAEYSPSDNFISNAAGPAYTAYIAKRAGVKRYIYAGSSSVYGYSENELYDEDGPATVSFPYGISKLQGERGICHLQSPDFSVIVLRQGTVSGHSPRMRFDLIVNTMFKCAIKEGVITVSNPSIWRPILAISDATSAYIRAIESNSSISGVFNVASVNCTVGCVADYVKHRVEDKFGNPVDLNIQSISDFRNYKVDIAKAEKVLSFRPQCSVEDITGELCDHVDEYGNFDDINYYNIEVFKKCKKSQS